MDGFFLSSGGIRLGFRFTKICLCKAQAFLGRVQEYAPPGFFGKNGAKSCDFMHSGQIPIYGRWGFGWVNEGFQCGASDRLGESVPYGSSPVFHDIWLLDSCLENSSQLHFEQHVLRLVRVFLLILAAGTCALSFIAHRGHFSFCVQSTVWTAKDFFLSNTNLLS